MNYQEYKGVGEGHMDVYYHMELTNDIVRKKPVSEPSERLVRF